MGRPIWRSLCFGLTLVATSLSADEIDDCDSGFIAFLGSEAYQFSPLLGGDLGSVRLFSVLSFESAAALGEAGRAFWRLEVRGPLPSNALVVRTHGHQGMGGARANADHLWDGRDLRGELVPAGTYRYTFQARFLPDRLGRRVSSYEDLARLPGVAEAHASTEELIVDYGLDVERSLALRASLAATTCETQQNAPLEAGFGYDFFYGSTHSHSNFSDGGHPTTSCSSGKAYGSGTFGPAQVYDYARSTAGMDYWVINEHNHLLNDSVATNQAPVTEAKVRQRYADGLAAAQAATADGVFVGVYGMEWGVTTNADQGHVTLLETPALFGWESCSNCNGPNPECTPGSNCYFDVYTPKRFGYLEMYRRSVEHPSPAGALGILCHPSSGQFDDYALDANADDALQGIAVRSGLAFNVAENCSNANVGATDYSQRWREALDKGFHVGPVAEHDAHCNTYGQGIPNRTVYLLPNGVSPSLTKAAWMEAHRGRRFYASEDANAQLVFTTSDGHLMGDVYDASGAVTLRAAAYDPAGETLAALEIWRGQIGGGVPASPYRSVANQSSLTFTESLPSGSYYYYVHAVQQDGHDLWSSPIWITHGAACSDDTPPAVAISAPAEGAVIACSDTVVRVAASDANGIAAVEVQVDSGTWNPAPFNAGSGFYEYLWPSRTAASGAHTLRARATDASCAALSATSAPRAVTVANSSCGLDLTNWRLAQANSTLSYTLPAGTTIPDGGYLVIGRDATQAAFEAFWRGGAPLPSNARYLDAAGAFPAINGDENFTLYNAGGSKADGRTINMAAAAGKSVQRKDPCSNASKAASWTVLAASAATPGSGAGAGCAKGVVINEFADASGTGNFVYEFVELHWDR